MTGYKFRVLRDSKLQNLDIAEMNPEEIYNAIKDKETEYIIDLYTGIMKHIAKNTDKEFTIDLIAQMLVLLKKKFIIKP